MITAASWAAATEYSFSSLPVRLRTFAPAARTRSPTAGEYVSTDTISSRKPSSTGSNLDFCNASPAREACASVDSAPMSIMSAPCSASSFPRRTACSVLRQTLSRYHESGERLITPMMCGWVLNAKCFAPIANSCTRALAASRLFSSNPANCSRLSILFARFRRDVQHDPFAFAHHRNAHRLADLHGIERVGVIINIRHLLPGKLHNDIAAFQPAFVRRTAAAHA